MLNKSSFLVEREHESHILKGNAAYLPKATFRVTVVKNIGKETAKLMTADNGIIELEEGTLIGLNELILANQSEIEIRSELGFVFRLGQYAEFSLELTVLGISPILYGNIWKGYLSGNTQPIVMCAKYRTSCYIPCASSFYTEAIDGNHDAFYVLSDNFIIWEFDERGKQFPIVTAEEGQKVVLEFDNDRPMRERYTVTSVEEISNKEYDYITESFLNPKEWR